MTGDPDSTSTPLAGWRVLVTRAPHQAAGLADPLAALGAEVVVAPVIDTAEPDDWGPADAAIRRLGEYDWVVLTSTNGVDRFVARMAALGVPLETLRARRVAVVGEATGERLRELGIEPALVPDDYRAEGLVEAFEAAGAGPGWRVLLPRAAKARDILPDALRSWGAMVDVVPVYRTVPATPDPAVVALLRAAAVDIVTFTSPSTVRHFIAWLEAAGIDAAAVMSRVVAASIGPVTSRALAERGYAVPIEAHPSTAEGLVDGITVFVAAAGEPSC